MEINRFHTAIMSHIGDIGKLIADVKSFWGVPTYSELKGQFGANSVLQELEIVAAQIHEQGQCLF
jgi:hypothetical protein